MRKVVKSIFNNLGAKLIEELSKFILMLVIYYCTNLFTDKDLYANIKGSLAIIVPYLIYIIVIIIISFLQKPIIVNVKMNNYLIKDKEETVFVHYDQIREDAQTVILELKVKENSSCWAKLAKLILKNKKITIKVELDPIVDEFICEPCEHPREVNYKGSYFTIDISKIILAKLDKNLPTSQQYHFMLKENRDNPPQINGEYHIKPSFLIEENKVGFLASRFIKYSLDMKNDYYIVNFIK